ncbi:MAG: TolC family protein [Synergistaceae bacterium]|nr:TolC family protein [Synergistaceae bacterium]
MRKILLVLTAAAIMAQITPLYAAEPLTLDECISAALAKHPDLAQAAAKYDSQKASISQKAASGRLQGSVGASYTRANGSFSNDNGDYGSNATLSQSIYDGGKRRLDVAGAKLNTAAASEDYSEAVNTVVADVSTAYYGLNRSIREHEVAQRRYDNYQKRLNWAKSYYEVGTKAKIEVTKAESDLANSKLTLVKADTSAAQMKAQLAAAMGEPLRKVDSIKDMLDYTEWSITAEEAVKRAIANKPELAAQQKRVEYAKTNLDLQKRGLYPTVSASAGYNTNGVSFFEADGWNAKLSLNIPILDGGATKSKVEGAEADLRAAEAKMNSLSNSVMLSVRKAWEALRQAKEALSASMEAERQAKATYDLAEGRYKAGVGNSLEISDAVESYAAAQTSTVLSLYNCKTARIDLEKAMGGRE